MWARYTIGGTVGPTLGGYLGTAAASRVAVVGCVLAAALVMLLPTKVDGSTSEGGQGEGSRGPGADDDSANCEPWAVRARAAVSATWPILAVKLCSAVINSMAGAVRPLVLKNDFGLSEAELGYRGQRAGCGGRLEGSSPSAPASRKLARPRASLARLYFVYLILARLSAPPARA